MNNWSWKVTSATTALIGSVVLARVLVIGPGTHPRRYAVSAGAAALLLLYAAYAALVRTSSPNALWRGADDRPSMSKFQALVWTVTVLFSYVGVFAVRRALNPGGAAETLPQVPAHLLTVMGLSLTTMAAAKGITVAYVNSGQVIKSSGGPSTTVTQDDDGRPDLTKIQMLWWTLVAVGIFLVTVAMAFKEGAHATLPDIDGSLMVLMGLSQGVYVGKKLVTVDTPTINPLSISTGPPGTIVTITGTSFGTTQGPSQVTLDGAPVPVASWNDTQIVLSIPSAHPTQGPWLVARRVIIDVLVNGTTSVAPAAFLVTLPSIAGVTPATAKPTIPVTILGSGFGSAQIPTRRVTVDGALAQITGWNDQQIVIAVPVMRGAGGPWPSGALTAAPIVVTVDQVSSQAFNAFSVQG